MSQDLQDARDNARKIVRTAIDNVTAISTVSATSDIYTESTDVEFSTNLLRLKDVTPGAPTSFTATEASSVITFGWVAPVTNISYVTGYGIYQSTDGGTTYTSVKTVGLISPLTTTLASPAAGQLKYKVAALVSALPGEYSSVVTIDVPDAPTSLAATSVANPVLTWTQSASANNSTITNYKIYRDESSPPTTLIFTEGDVATKTDSTAVAGTTYYYGVKATNGRGDSAVSNIATATTPSATSEFYTSFNTSPTPDPLHLEYNAGNYDTVGSVTMVGLIPDGYSGTDMCLWNAGGGSFYVGPSIASGKHEAETLEIRMILTSTFGFGSYPGGCFFHAASIGGLSGNYVLVTMNPSTNAMSIAIYDHTGTPHTSGAEVPCAAGKTYELRVIVSYSGGKYHCAAQLWDTNHPTNQDATTKFDTLDVSCDLDTTAPAQRFGFFGAVSTPYCYMDKFRVKLNGTF